MGEETSDSHEESLGNVIGGIAGKLALDQVAIALEMSALLALLVKKGILEPGEFSSHLEEYRREHESSFREDAIRRLNITEDPHE